MQTEWIICPICGRKTHNKIREDSGIDKLSSILSEMQAGNTGRRKGFPDNRHSKVGTLIKP